ncbi:Sensor histidine kinase YehU [compost metagenome]
MEIRQKEAQLQILYQQINPHLLYNTLESIYWKSSLEGNLESAEMIKELSKLMKISLSRGRELITLGEELEHAKAYIKLQQIRYEYSFNVIWEVPDEVQSQLIPKVTLQPLIENAIIHGVKNMEEDGVIRIKAWRENHKTFICIEDNGYKQVDYELIHSLLHEENYNPSTGYGIRNIQQRIRLHFGPLYGLYYTQREGGGTSVTMTLPAGEI